MQPSSQMQLYALHSRLQAVVARELNLTAEEVALRFGSFTDEGAFCSADVPATAASAAGRHSLVEATRHIAKPPEGRTAEHTKEHRARVRALLRSVERSATDATAQSSSSSTSDDDELPDFPGAASSGPVTATVAPSTLPHPSIAATSVATQTAAPSSIPTAHLAAALQRGGVLRLESAIAGFAALEALQRAVIDTVCGSGATALDASALPAAHLEDAQSSRDGIARWHSEAAQVLEWRAAAVAGAGSDAADRLDRLFEALSAPAPRLLLPGVPADDATCLAPRDISTLELLRAVLFPASQPLLAVVAGAPESGRRAFGRVFLRSNRVAGVVPDDLRVTVEATTPQLTESHTLRFSEGVFAALVKAAVPPEPRRAATAAAMSRVYAERAPNCGECPAFDTRVSLHRARLEHCGAALAASLPPPAPSNAPQLATPAALVAALADTMYHAAAATVARDGSTALLAPAAATWEVLGALTNDARARAVSTVVAAVVDTISAADKAGVDDSRATDTQRLVRRLGEITRTWCGAATASLLRAEALLWHGAAEALARVAHGALEGRPLVTPYRSFQAFMLRPPWLDADRRTEEFILRHRGADTRFVLVDISFPLVASGAASGGAGAASGGSGALHAANAAFACPTRRLRVDVARVMRPATLAACVALGACHVLPSGAAASVGHSTPEPTGSKAAGGAMTVLDVGVNDGQWRATVLGPHTRTFARQRALVQRAAPLLRRCRYDTHLTVPDASAAGAALSLRLSEAASGAAAQLQAASGRVAPQDATLIVAGCRRALADGTMRHLESALLDPGSSLLLASPSSPHVAKASTPAPAVLRVDFLNHGTGIFDTFVAGRAVTLQLADRTVLDPGFLQAVDQTQDGEDSLARGAQASTGHALDAFLQRASQREGAERAAAVAVAERAMTAWASLEARAGETTPGAEHSATVAHAVDFVPPPGAEIALVFPSNGDYDDFVAAAAHWGVLGEATVIPSAALPTPAVPPGVPPPAIGMGECLTLPVLQALQRRAVESNPASVATAHAHGVALRYDLPAPAPGTAAAGLSNRELRFLETFHVDPTAYRALRRRLALLRYRSEEQHAVEAPAPAPAVAEAEGEAPITWLRRILSEARTLDTGTAAAAAPVSEALEAASPYLVCDDDVRALCDMNVMQVRATIRFLQAEGVVTTAALFRCHRGCF